MVKNPHYRRIARTPAQTGKTALPSRFRRLRVLIVGAGDVGARLVTQLAAKFGDKIALISLTRRREQAQRLRKNRARVLAIDLDQRASLDRLYGFRHRVIQLAPPPASGVHDPRSRRLLAALRGPKPERFSHCAWVYASTTGVYGDVQGQWIAETRTPAPSNERAKRRLAAERQWRAAGTEHAARTPIVRVPGIYAANRLPIERLSKALPALHETEDVYTNHINADDLAWILWLTLLRGRSNRIYHAVDNSDLKMGDYFDLVADRLGLARPARLSRMQVACHVSPAMMSFMNESRRLINRRMSAELRVRLRFQTVADTLRQLET